MRARTLFLSLILAASAVQSQAQPGSAPVPLPASLASVSAPPGATVQLQIFLSRPQALVSGSATIDLDPTIFDNIAAADVYSALGDQIGTANIQGRHVEIEFQSQTGGIGRLPRLPVLSITVPVLSTAAVGATFSLTVAPGTNNWMDTQGVQYAVSIASGTFSVGGMLSVKNVAITGGLLPAASVVEIDGTGFSSATTVQIDGVAIGAVAVVSSQQINVTLAAAADLTSRRVVLQNPAGAPVTIYPVLHGSYVARPDTGTLATIQPIFPLQLYFGADAGSFLFSDAGLALQNPSGYPIDVTIQSVSPYGIDSQTVVTLPAGASYFQSGTTLGGADTSQSMLKVTPGIPIRMARIGSTGFQLVTPEPGPTTTVFAYFNGTTQLAERLVWNWTVGSNAPAPITLALFGSLTPTPFTLSASGSTASGSQWLSASPLQGAACLVTASFTPLNCAAPGLVTVTADPSHLTPGTYSGSLTFQLQGPNPQPKVIPATFNVYAQPSLIADQLSISLEGGSAAPATAILQLVSSAGALGYTTTVSTHSGQGWLSVAPSQGTTPATLTITANPTALTLSDTGTITITGPANTLNIPVSFHVFTSIATGLVTSPAALQFTYQVGQAAPAPLNISVPPTFDPFTVAATTVSGGNWLAAVVQNSPGIPIGVVSVNPSGLSAGTYQGSVTVTSKMATLPMEVPVTLTVWSGTPPPVAVSAPVLSLIAAHGTFSSQTINVSSGGVPLTFSATASTSDGTGWLGVQAVNPDSANPLAAPLTPGTAIIFADATGLAPGTYTGTVTITAPAGSSNSANIAVTLTVTLAPPILPQSGTVPMISAVVNAGSQQPGGLSPGEIFTILGQNIGPVAPAGFALGPDGKVATSLGGLQVLFDGVAAPLLYGSVTQLNAIVPYSVSGSTNITVQYNGTGISVGGYAVVDSAPGLFTLASNGQGAATVLNQDNSANTLLNAAARGSTVQIFGTGEGMTSPAGVTGEITTSDIKIPVLPVSVTIGGVSASVTYAGSAPGAIAGLFQVNAVVPQNVTSGSSVPIVITVGKASSQTNVTIAVR